MNEALNKMVQELKQEVFNDPESASDADALGILIARHFDWDTIRIAKTAASALEDANWHSLAGVIDDAIKVVESA